MLLKDSVYHIRSYFLIEYIARMYDHDRSLSTQALAACLNDFDLVLLTGSIDELVQLFHDLPAVVGCASGTSAYEDVGLFSSFSSIRIESDIDLSMLSRFDVF